MLGDALRSLLLGRGQEEWDVVLPQIMRAYRSTPHSTTQETPNILMLGREARVSEHLTYHVPAPESPVHEYVGRLIEIMGKAHDALRAQQWQIRMEDSEEPPLHQVGDWAGWWATVGDADSQLNFSPSSWVPTAWWRCCPTTPTMWSALDSFRYRSKQHLKPYHSSPNAVGQAPLLLESNRQPNQQGRVTQPREVEVVIWGEAEREQAALQEQLKQQQRQEQQQQQQQAPRPPSLSGEDTPTRVTGEGGDPPTLATEEPLALQVPVNPVRSQRDRKPPRYLTDYHVGHMEMSPQKSGTPSTGKNSEPQLQNSPGSTGLLQKQQPPDHLDNRYPALSGDVGQDRWRYPIPMTDLEPLRRRKMRLRSCYLSSWLEMVLPQPPPSLYR